MIKDDELLIASIEDKIFQCDNQNILTHTGFLDGRQCALVIQNFKNVKYVLWGGFEDAQRRIMAILPDYIDALDEENDPLSLVRVTAPKAAKPLDHRDYLGSILGLQITRDVIGDIIVSQHGADIVVLKSIAEFLVNEYKQVGNTSVSCEIVPMSSIDTGIQTIKEKKDTVASLRLDNVLASVYNFSRTKSQEAIKSGLVYLNNVQCIKPDANVSEGDKIVLRGRGKAVLKEVGGTTKKGRLYITIEQYV